MEWYLWVKALHVISVVSWMAGLLYLPRLMVYHTESRIGGNQSETFKIMERRLFRAIMNPALVVVWFSGLWMGWSGNHFWSLWLEVKFGLVLILTCVHFFLGREIVFFHRDLRLRRALFYRVLNEVPTVILIAVIVIVVVKPF